MKHCLSNVRVLEIGQVLAAPYAGMILGDLGADVIKIESPRGGDSARRTPPHFCGGESIYFMAFNRNKRSISIDLETDRGLQIFYDLVSKSDVVLDNLRSGVLQKLKIDHETLLEYNPQLVSCSINGYGSYTPDSAKPAFDLMVQARGGGMSLTGEPGGPPLRMGISVSDHVAGIYAVVGILAALHERQHTGKGKRIEVPLFSTMISLLSYEAAFHLYSGEIPGPVGSGHRSLVPYGAVTTKDGHIVIAAHQPNFWSLLCMVLEIQDVETDPRFESLEARGRNQRELWSLLNEKFHRKTSQEWIEILEAIGIPCAPINNLQQALSDPATVALRMVTDIEHKGVGGTFRFITNPIRTPGAGEQCYLSPPLLGQHTREILREVLTYPEGVIEELMAGQVVMASSVED